MKVFMIVLGVLLMLGGLSCIATPVLAFVGAGFFIVMLLLVYGIVSIIGGIANRDYGLKFIYGILSAILGIAIIFVPGIREVSTAVVLYIMAAWFILKGIVSIYGAVKAKRADIGNIWICGVVAGILSILIGAYSAFHPIVLAMTVGLLVGLYFIISGVDLIVVGLQYDE